MHFRLATLALILPALLLTPFGSSAATKLQPRPPKMWLSSGGETVRAVQGTFCWDEPAPPTQGSDPTGGAPGGLCADYAYPLPVRCRLSIQPGDVLKVRAAERIRGSVTVGLVIPDSGLAGFDFSEWQLRKKSRAGRSNWRFHIPPGASSAIAIDIEIYGPQGDSDAWTGLATDACRSSEFGK